MITIRRAKDRGHADHGWLNTNHSFSFGQYHDPEHMGFRSLRVLNDDIVAPGKGFPTHPHRDMEIISYVLEGAMEHKDSTGGGGVLRNGDVQCMTAGTGVTHSEFNHSKLEPVHFLQIWIIPEREGLEPAYEQKHFAASDRSNCLCVIASPDEREASLRIHEDVVVYAAMLDEGAAVKHKLATGRHGWVQVARGDIILNGEKLSTGDGAAISDEAELQIAANAQTELLLFDLA